MIERKRHGARIDSWQRERRAFERLLPSLRRRFAGRYVAIHRSRIAGSDAGHDVLFARVWRKLHGATFFIGRVGGETPTVDVPGFEVK